jgi:predicted AlkP superfamily pyrophosphatase or phosphodiesterase
MLPAAKRPHLITFYFPEVDHAGHEFGPDAPETAKAIAYVDEQVDLLVKAVKQTGLDVNFIFVSDHGMTAVDRKHPIATPTVINKDGFTIVSSGTMINLYAKDTAAILPCYEALKAGAGGDYQVYLKKDMPPRLHYGAADDKYNVIGDIILLSVWPKVFSDQPPIIGYHGFDPYEVKEMDATFIAWGSAFKNGLQIDAFPNVDVYPVIAKILGLKITEPIDGTDELANKVLKR